MNIFNTLDYWKVNLLVTQFINLNTIWINYTQTDILKVWFLLWYDYDILPTANENTFKIWILHQTNKNKTLKSLFSTWLMVINIVTLILIYYCTLYIQISC